MTSDRPIPLPVGDAKVDELARELTHARAAIEARSTSPITARYALIASRGTSTPRSRWASSTAIHSSRSSTTLRVGDQMWTISSLA